MPELYLARIGETLAPMDEQASEWVKRQQIGRPQLLKVSTPRNQAFHRKGMKLLNYAHQNSEQDPLPPFEQWRKALTILAGFYDVILLPSGKSMLVAQSLSFSSMDEETFESWYSATIDAILKHVLTRHTKDEVVRQVLAFG